MDDNSHYARGLINFAVMAARESKKRIRMGRQLRIAGIAVSAAIAFYFFAAYNQQPAKPIPVPLTVAEETKIEPPRAVRVIQIYKTPSDQVPDETAPVPVSAETISAFLETTTMDLPETLPSSLPTPPPPPAPPPLQKTAAGFCEQFHMHKVFSNNGKSWRCVR